MGAERDRRRGDERVVRELLVEEGRASRATQCPQLEVDVRPLRMDAIDNLTTEISSALLSESPSAERRAHLLPRGDLGVVPHTRSVGLAAGLARDIRCLRNKEGAWDAGALLVVLEAEVRRHVRVVVTITGQGGEDDAVCESNIADQDGLKES